MKKINLIAEFVFVDDFFLGAPVGKSTLQVAGEVLHVEDEMRVLGETLAFHLGLPLLFQVLQFEDEVPLIRDVALPEVALEELVVHELLHFVSYSSEVVDFEEFV